VLFRDDTSAHGSEHSVSNRRRWNGTVDFHSTFLINSCSLPPTEREEVLL
jgi:hypothetical protein